MRKKTVVPILLLLLLALSGCGYLASITPEKPLGSIDPNEVQNWIDVGVGLGHTVQTVGIATGNPAFIAYGAALIVIGGYLTTILKGKKDGES